MYRSGHRKKKKRLSDAAKDFKRKGTEGSLTRIAHRHGVKSPLKFARRVEAHPSRYSSKTEKKARWAVNMNK